MANIDSVEIFVGKLERKKSKIPDLHSNFNDAPAESNLSFQKTGNKLISCHHQQLKVGKFKHFFSTCRSIFWKSVYKRCSSRIKSNFKRHKKYF